MATHPPSSTSPLREGEDGRDDQEHVRRTDGSGHVVIPEDGYKWKKYGQKYIRRIQKNRSYFKCRNRRCRAKKRVEWSPSDNGSDMRIVYDGVHDHPARPSSDQEASTSTSANQFDLANQVFGQFSDP